MKCQQCDHPAVFHITELESGAVREIHLCEDHARVYLNQSEGEVDPDSSESTEEGGKNQPAVGKLAGPLGVAQTADELSRLDQKVCDMCGITFFEFRNQGRLGCPHDYIQFERELEPLIANIHDATQHTGRRPSRTSVTDASGSIPKEPLSESTAELSRAIGLRRKMREAIACEDYEKAKENRDSIRTIEERWLARS